MFKETKWQALVAAQYHRDFGLFLPFVSLFIYKRSGGGENKYLDCVVRRRKKKGDEVNDRVYVTSSMCLSSSDNNNRNIQGGRRHWKKLKTKKMNKSEEEIWYGAHETQEDWLWYACLSIVLSIRRRGEWCARFGFFFKETVNQEVLTLPLAKKFSIALVERAKQSVIHTKPLVDKNCFGLLFFTNSCVAGVHFFVCPPKRSH